MIKKNVRLFVFIPIIYLILTSFSFSNETKISEILVKGAERIDIDTIISYSSLSIDDTYSDEIGNQILKRLFDTDLFSDIKISFADESLIISVIENPTVNLISFEGNKKKSDEELLGEISLGQRSIYSRSKVKKDTQKLLTFYQRAGRLSTIINPKVEVLDNNRVNLIFDVVESDVVTVSKINFIGNKYFSSSELRKVMKTKPSTLLRILSSADNYDPDKVEYDKELITEFYNNNGFPNFNFTSSIAQLVPNKNKFELIFTIDEGEEYNFGNINIENKLTKLNNDGVLKIIPVKVGNLYVKQNLKSSIKSIKDNAAIFGYTFIDIKYKEKFNNINNTVDIIFSINEGPKVYVNRINIEGNSRTTDSVIRRQMILSEGDPYNKFEIDISKDRLQSLGFFENVDITEERTEEFDKINLNISMSEKNTGEASLGAGYSSVSKASLQFSLIEQNFLGKGQKLKFISQFGDENTTYDFSFAEPYVRGKDLYFKSDLYNSVSDSTAVNYDTSTIGLGFELGFPIALDKRINSRYSLYSVKTTPDANATAYENSLSGTDTTSSIGYTFTLDKRNSRYRPSSGYNLVFDQDIAGIGGNSYYIKDVVKYNYYKRLTKKLIGSIKLNMGNINGYNGNYAPLSSYFKLGGSNLRGFKYGKVGPKFLTSYLGGQYYYLLQTETNIDLPIESFDIKSVLFADIGSVFGINDQYNYINDEHKVRSSVGINFLWDSAIGPINLVFSEVINQEATDQIDNFYFDIGYNF